MPPHVEERIKNIREKLERKMEPADRKVSLDLVYKIHLSSI